MTEEKRRKSREYKQKYRLKKLGLLPPPKYDQIFLKIKADPPEMADKEATERDSIIIKRHKVDKIAAKVQSALTTEWRKRHKNQFIIVVEGGAIKGNTFLRYHVELYQLGMTDEVIKEFEDLCKEVVKQWQHEYDDIDF